MSSSKLPIIALPHPLILLPASRFTMPVSREIGEVLLSLIDESDTLPVVAAIPTTNQPTSPDTEPVLAEWGTAARVLRLVKPPARNSRQPYLVSLHGLTRVRLIYTSKHNLSSEDLLRMPMHGVEYPPTEKVPSRETANKFKQGALRLLDRLAKDSLQQSRKEGYHKIASMLEDITDARTPWMADVLIGSVNGEYADKLGEFNLSTSTCHIPSFQELRLHAQDVIPRCVLSLPNVLWDGSLPFFLPCCSAPSSCNR
jgi:ATP-dependent Lon protease